MLQTTITIANRDYDILEFRTKFTNKPETIKGAALARGFLAVTGQKRIYNTISGEPILRGKFETLELACEFAQWIEKTFWEYFDIWQTYPDANLISWCKYTVPDGAMIHEMVEELTLAEIITRDDLIAARNKATISKEKWKA